MFSFRVYIFIGIIVAAVCSAVVFFDGPGGGAESFFNSMSASSSPFLGDTIANFIFTPLTNIFTDYYWAVGAGILWPLVIVWIILLLIGIGATIIGPTVTELNTVG